MEQEAPAPTHKEELMSSLLSCIYFYSALNQIDPRITHAVISVESNWNTQAVGTLNEQGLMQVRPEHVPVSIAQLRDPCTNIKYGTAILKRAMNKCKHQLDNTWVLCFNLGLAGGKKIKHPKKYPYYLKIVSKL